MSSRMKGDAFNVAAQSTQPNEDRRPRILVVAPRFPYPLIGGDRLRLHNLCVALSRRYRLTLLSLCDDRGVAQRCAPPDGIFGTVEQVFLPQWQSWMNCLRALLTRTPLQVAYYWSRVLARRVRDLAPQHDAILCHLIRSAEYALPFRIPRILEMTDAISLNYRRMKDSSGRMALRRLVYAFEQSRLEAFERQIVDNFDVAVLVSDADRQFLFADDLLRRRKVLVCSNGVDSASLAYQFQECCTNRIVFVGNMTTLQNLDAAEWFARTTLPLIRAKCPDAVFEVVGYRRVADVRHIARLPGVRIVGEVRSIAEAVKGAAVGVCPIRFGAGIQNKVLEYMALGLPSVTTSVTAAGLAAQPGHELLVADTAEEMAESVSTLLIDRARARRIAEAARLYVERHHAWSVQLDPLLAKLDDLLRSVRHRGRHTAPADSIVASQEVAGLSASSSGLPGVPLPSGPVSAGGALQRARVIARGRQIAS